MPCSFVLVCDGKIVSALLAAITLSPIPPKKTKYFSYQPNKSGHHFSAYSHDNMSSIVLVPKPYGTNNPMMVLSMKFHYVT